MKGRVVHGIPEPVLKSNVEDVSVFGGARIFRGCNGYAATSFRNGWRVCCVK